MYGIQTVPAVDYIEPLFENDVKMYGIQTQKAVQLSSIPFENDVKMYGIQTLAASNVLPERLRMM